MTNQEDEKNLAAVAIAPRVSLNDLEANVKSVQYRELITDGGQVMRWAVITTQSGFGVTGAPGVAVSPENDIPEFGRKVAYDNAFAAMWPLMGYELKTKLSLIAAAGEPTGQICHLGNGVKTYVGTKVVRAVAMCRGDYNVLRGWTVPHNENPDDAGYLVEYTDGGAQNVEGFTGYISWSPRDVFERAYTVGVEPKKTTYRERLVAELDEVNSRVTNCKVFIEANPIYQTLAGEEQKDLREQLIAMESYQWFLGRRVRRLTA